MEKDLDNLAEKHAKDFIEFIVPELEEYWFSGKKIEIYQTDMDNLITKLKGFFIKFAEDLNG